jgi:F0F1-type ATP synthase membrane subunit b/b'
MKKSILAGVCALLLVVAAVVFAAQPPPVRNVNPRRHPHIAAAQQAARRAFNQITEAQRANEWDMEGHAQRAKELLDQVNNELGRAAGEANEHAH